MDAALAQIDELLTSISDDYSFMRRIALVETNFGQVSNSGNGVEGIWKVVAESMKT